MARCPRAGDAAWWFILGGALKLAWYEATLLRLQRTVVPHGAPGWHAAAIGLLLGTASTAFLSNAYILLRAVQTVGVVDGCVFAVLSLLLVLGSALAPPRRRASA